MSTAQLRVVAGLGGLVVLISIVLPWFSASSAFGSTSFSLVSVSGNIAGFPLGPNVTLSDAVANTVAATLFFVLLGALLSFAGYLRYPGAQAFGVIAVMIGAIVFAAGISQVLPLSGNACIWAYVLPGACRLDSMLQFWERSL